MQNKPCEIINMLEQSVDTKKKSNTEAKNSRNSRSSTSFRSNSGNVSKIPCCIRTGSKSKPQSESRLRKKDKSNKTEDDGNDCLTQVSLTANIDTVHQEKLNEVILRSSQHEKDILSDVEDIFYRKISSPEIKSAPLDILESVNVNVKSKLNTVTNKKNVTIHNREERKVKSVGKGDVLSEANHINTVQKIKKKFPMKKPFISNHQENVEERNDILKNVDVLCHATSDRKLKKCRPATAPIKKNDDVQIIQKSTSFTRYSEKTLASKIPIPLKTTNESNNKGGIEKSETSPELANDVGNFENIKVNVKESKTKMYTSSRIPARLKSTSASCKKQRFAKRRNVSKRRNRVKSCDESVESPIEVLPTNKLKLVILTSPEADASKSANNTTLGETPNIHLIEEKVKIDNPTSSRIPIGVRSAAGISSINTKGKQIRITNSDKMTKLRKNLVKRMMNYQVMSVPIISYLERPKCFNLFNKGNWKISRKYEDIEKGKQLDRKESLANIFKRKLHLCCGDKVRSSSKIFFSNKSSSKLSSILRSNNNIGNKTAKLKRRSNTKSREGKDKFNFKSNASSPNVIQIIPDSQGKRTHSKEFEDNEIHLRRNSFQIGNFPIKNEEKRGLNDDIKWFSDTDLLLKLQTEERHMFRKKRKLRKMFCDEKSIQAKTNTNDFEIQIDISNGEAKKSVEISSRNFATNTPQPVQFYDDFKAINDYCTAILETKTNIEEVLKKCSSASSIKSADIGCQSEVSESIDSSSQTLSRALITNCRCCKAMHLTTLNELTTIKNYENSTRPKLNINRTNSSSNIRESVISEERTPRKLLLYLTLDASATGLDPKNFRSNMSCYCKEVPLDQKGKIEEERPRNLFEDDDDGVDYSEGYMQELINTIHLEKHSSICGSTPSLPDVAVGTDRCESKLEIPWLKISLAPPGYYEIKKQEGRPKKVLCDCWNLSANDDVYSEPVVQEVEEPKCKCASKAVDNPKSDEGPKKSEVTFEHNMSETDENQKGKIEEGEMEEEIIGQDEIGDNKIGKEPSLQKPASKIKTKSQTEQDTVDAPQNEPSEINRKKENEKSATSTQEKSAQKLTKKESKKSAGSVEENPSAISTQEKSAQKLTKTESKNSVTSVEEKPSATSTQEKSSQKLTRKESKKSATSIEEKPSATSAQERSKQKLTKKESKKSATSVQEEEALLEEKDNDCPSSSSSSSSLPSDCICLAQKECEDILGQPTAFVFDNPCFAQHEGYMDPIYKLFPDDCDTYCGPHIEMPWSDLTIPRKIKLRQAKKKIEPESSSKCPCKPPEEVEPKTPPKCPCKPPEDVEPKSSSKSPSKPPEEVVCGKKEDTTVLTEPQVTPASDNPESPVEKIDKSFEIQLSFTEIISNMAALENKCEPSGVSVSIRPSSKERSSCSEPRPSSYSCRCSSPRSKQNSPTLKNRTSKSKNTNCKCPSRDVSFAKIESDTSHGSRCKNPSCKPSSPNGKSSRRTSDQAKPIQKSSYQDPVMNVLETCEAEMEPLRDTLNQLKCKIRNLNIPELNNWNNNPMQCPPCCTSRPVTSPTLQQQSSLMNRTSGMPVPHSMPAPPSMQPPPQNFPSMQLAPPCMQAPSQNFPPMQRPPQFPFPPMFPPMTPLPPPGMPPQGMPPKGMPPKGMPPQGMPPRRCCPQCACKEIRSRRRSPRSASSSTEFSEYDSLSDEGSGCPFLRALSSSKNIYKDRESRTQRKCRDRDDKRKADRPSKKCPNCTAKKYNKRSQIEYSRQDICTDTEPEIQVHYGPKRPKMKTKHVFKGVVDKTNMNMAKNQRLRIAVRLSPSGEEVIDDNYLAIQGPCEYK